ncbi:MAG TPA: hypothetical protein VIW29_14045, partial [Polyangiaceae bacterium]
MERVTSLAGRDWNRFQIWCTVLPMSLRRKLSWCVLGLPLCWWACGNSQGIRAVDRNDDTLADDLGTFVDVDGNGAADDIDINGDGQLDGPGVDTDDDGRLDALALDTDCDGVFDSLDTTGDGRADWVTQLAPPAD